MSHGGADAPVQVDPRRFVATGALVAFTECLAFYPLEYMKTREQFRRSHWPETYFYRTGPNLRWPFRTNLYTQMSTIVRHRGVLGLYRGFYWYILTHVPEDVIHYYCYTRVKEFCRSTSLGSQYPTLSYALAGAVADVATMLVGVPFEIVSQRVQVRDIQQPELQNFRTQFSIFRRRQQQQRDPFSGKQIMIDIYKNEGWRGLYRGFGLSLMLTIPGSAVWWAASEATKTSICETFHRKPSDPIVHAVAGGTAGAIVVLLINPLDVVKTRLQTAGGALTGHHILKSILFHEGREAFLKGLVPRLLSAVPRSALSFVVYEFTVKMSRLDNIRASDS